jgi:phospholipid-translocating ATPase/phospholipid-transporting ATPase
LDASNLLLRGCTLRKTEWVIGVVVFTGKGSVIPACACHKQSNAQ